MEPSSKRFASHLFLPPSNGLEEQVAQADKDVYYFATYDKIQIHEDMIRDSVRTQGYRYAMMQNKAMFRDKVVIDVGCGTGILSMFAVQAGARKVYALERSEEIANEAEKLIAANGMSDKICIIRGMAEDLKLPEKADVIVSEWMGYFLLYEWMLESVLSVRDRFLKPDGQMFPSEATLHVALLSNPELYDARINFWSEKRPMLGGLDLSSLVPFAQRCNFQEPVVEPIEGDQLASRAHTLLCLNLRTCTRADFAHLEKSFSLSGILRGPLSGLVGWFDVAFPGGLSFSTGPDTGKITHWRQTQFFLNKPLELELDTNVNITFSMKQCSRNPRFLEFQITYNDDVVQDYLMA